MSACRAWLESCSDGVLTTAGSAPESQEFYWAGGGTEQCSEPVVFASAVHFVSEERAAWGLGGGRELEMVAVRNLRTVAVKRVAVVSEKAREKPPLSQPGPALGGLSCCRRPEGVGWFVTSSMVQLEAPFPQFQLRLSFPAARVFWSWILFCTVVWHLDVIFSLGVMQNTAAWCY